MELLADESMPDALKRAFLVTHPDIPHFRAVAFAQNPEGAKSACAEVYRRHGERHRRSKFRPVRAEGFDPLLDFDLPEVIDVEAATHILVTGSTEPPLG